MKNIIRLYLIIIITLTLALPLAGFTADPAPAPTVGEGIGQAAGMGSISFTPNVAIGDFSGCTFGSDQSSNNCLGLYINAWYGFALGTVGILATFMIMYAGFKYLTSRGDGKAVGDAKDIMISGITGVIIAFLSYTILNLVNPKLLTIHMPVLPKIEDTSGLDISQQQGASAFSQGSGGGGVNQGSPSTQPQSQAIQEACADSDILDYDNMNIPTVEKPGVSFAEQSNGQAENYWFDCYGQRYGVDANLLRGIAAAESGGNANIGSSPAGACGLMQILPSTASGLAGRDVTCAELSSNASLSIELAARYISQNQGNFSSVSDRIAGYNGGYDTTAGSGHALSPSQDCADAGVRAYQCCTNPGGLTETQNYVYNVRSYQNYYEQNNTNSTPLSDTLCK